MSGTTANESKEGSTDTSDGPIEFRDVAHFHNDPIKYLEVAGNIVTVSRTVPAWFRAHRHMSGDIMLTGQWRLRIEGHE